MGTRPRFALTVVLLVSACSLLLLAKEIPSGDAGSLQLQVADMLFSRSDYRAALALYRSVAENEGQEVSVRTRGRMGMVRSALRVAEFQVAASQAASIEIAAPDDPSALSVVGDALWAAGRFGDAERSYRAALAIQPGFGRAKHGLGLTLAARGREEDALVAVRDAIAAAPSDAEMHATEGAILERMGRYDEAVTAYTAFLAQVPASWHPESVDFIRGQVQFLRAFVGRHPFEVAFKNGGDSDVIPFRMINGKVVVRARVNGSDPQDFTVDTGAEHTVLTAPTAKRLGIAAMGQTIAAGVGIVGLRGVERGRLDSLQFGSVVVRDLPCLIKNPPIEGLPVGEAEGLSPIAFGLSMSIDYQRRLLTVARHLPAARNAGDVELPLWRHRLATVEGRVNGMPAAFIVDTGGEVVSLNTTTARFLVAPADRRRIALRVYGTSGLDPEAYLMPGVDLLFDTVHLANQSVVVLNLRAPSVLLGYHIGGIVGHKFLSHYKVDFDLDRSVLRLTKQGA